MLPTRTIRKRRLTENSGEKSGRSLSVRFVASDLVRAFVASGGLGANLQNTPLRACIAPQDVTPIAGKQILKGASTFGHRSLKFLAGVPAAGSS